MYHFPPRSPRLSFKVKSVWFSLLLVQERTPYPLFFTLPGLRFTALASALFLLKRVRPTPVFAFLTITSPFFDLMFFSVALS